ncbi:MAG: DUF11 domain-containing protein [Oligosphaeraceae bacterium]|nr:DUF11 domain-containing protein [Oligosphaeraceae bacterium]
MTSVFSKNHRAGFSAGFDSATSGIVAVAVFCLAIFGLAGNLIALTPAQTRICNQSTASYRWQGRDHGIASNPVFNLVAPCYGILIKPDGTAAAPRLNALADPGSSVYFSYVLKNTGNITDSYALELKFAGGNFFPAYKAIYIDTNSNGKIDPGEAEITKVENLPAGSKVNLLMRIDVPANTNYGEYILHDLQGKSLGDPSQTDTENINRINLVRDVVLRITKSPNVVSVTPGSKVQFSLDLINNGSVPAKAMSINVDGSLRRGILVSDQLQGAPHSRIRYVPGSLNAAPASHLKIFKLDSISSQWRQLDATEQENYKDRIVEVAALFLGDGDMFAPPQQARVLFEMLIAADHSAGIVENISRVDYHNRNDEPRHDEATNTVQIIVRGQVDGLLIGPYQQPEAKGSTFGVYDNNGDASIDPGVPATPPNPYGTQVAGNVVYFLNTVRNDANATDTINLTIDELSNLPADWLPLARIMAVSGIEQRYNADGSVLLHPATGEQLFKPSNVSTLFDSNGDGIPDTGPLAPGQSYTVAVRVVIPLNAVNPNARAGTNARNDGTRGGDKEYADNDGRGYRVTLRATSTLDPTRYNLTSNIIERIMDLNDFWDPFTKDHQSDEQLYPGSKIRYTNTFGNNGPGPVYNTIIIDELSEYLTNISDISNGRVKKLAGPAGKYVDATGSYDPITHSVSWHIFEIPPGFVGQIGFTAEVAEGVKNGTEIPNVFAISSDQTDFPRTSNKVYDAVGGEKVLTLEKKVSTDKVEIGDPVRYELHVANAGEETIRNVMIEDILPKGFRYLKKSAKIDRDKVEPEISKDGSILTWSLGSLAPGEKVVISYVCVVTSDIKLGSNTNSAMASGRLPKGSRIRSRDSVDVDVEIGIFHNDSVIFGKVFIDQNDDRIQNHAEPGVAGVRLILENGTYVTTDREGKYHFSGIKPGMHVLRLDETSLPPGMKAEIIDSQNIFNPLSRTIELRWGTPHKANFRLRSVKDAEESAAAATKSGDAETLAEADKQEAAVVKDNVLKPIQVQLQDARSLVMIECEEDINAQPEYDENSGIVHVLLPGVTSSTQPERLALDDPNVSSLQCHLDQEQKRAKVQIRLRKRTSGYNKVEYQNVPKGLIVQVGGESAPDHDPTPAQLKKQNARLLEQDEFQPRILTPENGEAFVSSNQFSVTAACFLAAQPKLFVNDEEVPESRIGLRSVDIKTRRITFVYYGLNLQPGKNTVRFEALNPGAKEPVVDQINIYRANTPASILLRVLPQPLMADGLTEPQLLITLLDSAGVPTGHGTVVTITVDKGDILSPDLRTTEPGHQAQIKDGSTLIRLSAASSPQVRKVTVTINNLRHEMELTFAPHQRSWIVNGIISGTATERHSKEANISGTDKDWKLDDRIAVFAKGALPKDFVLTAAYDSKKPRDDRKVFERDDILKYYPVYGDESEQEYEAESRDKLYIKLERDQSYLMYGDFDSNMDKTELAAYKRAMTGAKLHLESKYADLDGFFSRNDQVQIKGLQIPGRGVSGYYTLPDKNIIINSEKVVIETRDRWHPDRVLESKTMNRYTDYSIDYSTGRILFKKPVPSRDEDNNPVYVVVDYEIDGRKSKNYNTYGARGQLHNAERTMHIGATTIRDEAAPYDHTIEAVDASIQLIPGLTLKGEVAQSQNFENQDGSAWYVELEGSFDKARYRLYHRDAGSKFENLSMSGDRAGLTSTGFEGEFDLNENWSTKEELYRETDTTEERRRYVAIHDFVFKKDSREFTLGMGYTQEEITATGKDEGKRLKSPFARIGTAFDLTRKLRLELFHQQAFGDKDTDQGTRSTADLRYSLNQHLDLLAGMERREVQSGDTEVHLNAGMELSLNESTTAFHRYKLEDSASGQRVRSGSGLDVQHSITPEWKLGASAEYGRALRTRGEMSTDDFWALSLSGEYQPDGGKGTAIARFELRDEKDSETSYLTEIGGTLKLNIDHTLFGRNIANYIIGKKDNNDSLSLDFLIGWAYRPVDFDKLNIISDLEMKYEDKTDVADYGRLNKLIFSIEGNYQPLHRLVLEGKYACKLVSASYLSSPLYSDVKALGARVDLNDRFFISAGARLLSQYDVNAHTISYGGSLGVNVAKDARIAFGYNFEGFKDKDFARGDHWDKGFYIAFHWKFDESIFGILRRLEGTDKK